MGPINAPAPKPCESCPYRTDVPSGVWSAGEYAKLRRYDNDTPFQPYGVFQCHQNGPEDDRARLCAGWVACHGEELLALRLAVARGDVDPSVFDYSTDVEVFATGTDAAEHGERDIVRPGRKAKALVAKIARMRMDATFS